MAKTPRRESKEPAKNSAQARETAAREERVAFLKFLMNSDRPISPEERNERKRFFHRLFHKKRSVLGSIHDIFFFVVMSDRKFLIEVMKKYFPDLAEALDFDKLTFEPTTRVNALFERKVADLVFVVPCKDPQNADVRIHIIAEHKAQHGRRDNRRTLLNIHEYVNLTTKAILNDLESDKSKKSDRCPQAIAIIFYTGKNEKYEAPKWSDLFFLPKELERYLISLEIPCVNITRLLTNGKIKGSPLVRGAFSALGYAGKGVLGKNFGAVVKILSKIKKIDWRARFLIDACFTYAFGSANNEGQEITERVISKRSANWRIPR
ncbi:MAG: Rpn family recombination-promoting nuclease/putative transposase [Thermoguttaceae bacterium]|nr:Rpn family recombination-promoting nuclease/putative transposase [Thermoguttaceae bacterium]